MKGRILKKNKPDLFIKTLLSFGVISMLGMPITADASDIISEGTCGDGVYYTVDSDYTLTISGDGYMNNAAGEYDYWLEDMPYVLYMYEIKKVVIEDGVKNIGDMAFYGFKALQEVSIADSVETIGQLAFADTKVKKVKLPANLNYIDYGAFENANLSEIEFPQELNAIGGSAFWGNKLKKIIFSDSLQDIGESAFGNKVPIEELYISNAPAFTEGSDIFSEIYRMNGLSCSYSDVYAEQCKISLPCNANYEGYDKYGVKKNMLHIYHDYDEGEFVWSEDGEKCDYVKTCQRDASHQQKTALEVSAKVEKKATTSKNGKLVCTANYKKKKAEKSFEVPMIKTLCLDAYTMTYQYDMKKPSIAILDAELNEIPSKYYTVNYKNADKVGKATLTVALKGRYEGTLSETYLIIPQKTTITNVESKKKSLFVSWNKQNVQTNGYKVEVSTDKKFEKDVKTVKVEGNKITSTTVKHLKSNKKYYVRICTYKLRNGKVYASNYYTFPKAVKTK